MSLIIILGILFLCGVIYLAPKTPKTLIKEVDQVKLQETPIITVVKLCTHKWGLNEFRKIHCIRCSRTQEDIRKPQ